MQFWFFKLWVWNMVAVLQGLVHLVVHLLVLQGWAELVADLLGWAELVVVLPDLVALVADLPGFLGLVVALPVSNYSYHSLVV